MNDGPPRSAPGPRQPQKGAPSERERLLPDEAAYVLGQTPHAN